MDWGQAFRGFVPVATQLDQQRRDEAFRQEQLGLQKQAEGRSAEQFGWARDDRTRAEAVRKRQDSIMDAARQLDGFRQTLGQPDSDVMDTAGKMVQFWNDHPEMQNGQTARMTTLNGVPMLVNGSLSRNDVTVAPVTRETLQKALSMGDDQLRRNLAYAGGPEAFDRFVTGERTYGLEGRKVGAAETTAGAAMKQAEAAEGMKNVQAEFYRKAADTGNWGQLDLNKAHAGLYNRMPADGAGGARGAFGSAGKQVPIQVFDTDTGQTKTIAGTPVLDKRTGEVSVKLPDGRTVSESDVIQGVHIGEGAGSPFLGKLMKARETAAWYARNKDIPPSDKDRVAAENVVDGLSAQHSAWVTNRRLSNEKPTVAATEIEAAIASGKRVNRQYLMDNGYSPQVIDYVLGSQNPAAKPLGVTNPNDSPYDSPYLKALRDQKAVNALGNVGIQQRAW